MSTHHIADTVCMSATLDCGDCKMTYSSSGMAYITGANDSADTYEIPLEVWRLFNSMVERMECNE